MRFGILLTFILLLMGCGQQEATETVREPSKPEALPVVQSPEPKKEEIPYRVWYRDQVLILNYHHIAEDFDSPHTIKPNEFREHIEFLKNHHFHPLKLEEFHEFLDTGLLNQENAVLLTFDDGYESAYSKAFPVLEEYQFPATVFVIYENLRDTVERKREGKISPLSFVQLEQMKRSGLISFQSHTYGLHFVEDDRPATSPEVKQGDQAYRSKVFVDFMMGRKALEDLVREPVLAISYPYGYYNDRMIKVSKQAGYQLGFAGGRGLVNAKTNPFKIPKNNMGERGMDIFQFEQEIKAIIHESKGK
ncbi:polysaccharide deacetylase family protein [Ammoniphilus sp. YIM 78166]|uniref:polysaccharide deacetylase family protein n=1 Tax=Ammoniphilus sp. YIM 78166 TaxID=1644106 RepID=UPI00106F3563|nr:polysaccharide deacetylase family protein [Ammoniphilus sp. YIM 78166]